MTHSYALGRLAKMSIKNTAFHKDPQCEPRILVIIIIKRKQTGMFDLQWTGVGYDGLVIQRFVAPAPRPDRERGSKSRPRHFSHARQTPLTQRLMNTRAEAGASGEFHDFSKHR